MGTGKGSETTQGGGWGDTLLKWALSNEHTKRELEKRVKRCIIMVEGKYYDVTNWAKHHPGGDVILKFHNKDATEIFRCFHAEATWDKLRFFEMKKEDTSKVEELPEQLDGPVLEDLRALTKEVEAEGLFHADPLYYVFKTSLILGLIAFAFYSVFGMAPSLLMHMVGALALGIAWQQSGWLSHDFLHHQVLDNRTLGTAMGYFLGNFLQGFSVDWWKNKHNTHHALPNVHGDDPDIDTMPLLAWDEADLARVDAEWNKWVVEHQTTLMWPLLCLARISWAIQGFLHTTGKSDKWPARTTEVSLICAHWLWVGVLMYGLASVAPAWEVLLFFVVSQCSAGLGIGVVFVVGHSGRPIVPLEMGRELNHFVMQVRHSRNIAHSWYDGWFYGGLQYQIEHHVFPAMPRHSLPKVAGRVRALCVKHKIEYDEKALFPALDDVYEVLNRVSAEASKLDLSAKKAQ